MIHILRDQTVGMQQTYMEALVKGCLPSKRLVIIKITCGVKGVVEAVSGFIKVKPFIQ